jgi:hypothetical protein
MAGRGKSAKSLELVQAAHDILNEIQPPPSAQSATASSSWA